MAVALQRRPRAHVKSAVAYVRQGKVSGPSRAWLACPGCASLLALSPMGQRNRWLQGCCITTHADDYYHRHYLPPLQHLPTVTTYANQPRQYTRTLPRHRANTDIRLQAQPWPNVCSKVVAPAARGSHSLSLCSSVSSDVMVDLCGTCTDILKVNPPSERVRSSFAL